MNAGKRFEAKFREAMEPHGFVLRICDRVYSVGGRIVGEETEADFLVVTGAGSFLVECKATGRKSLEFHNVKEHQERALADFDGVSGSSHGFFAVEFYDKESYRRPRRMFLMPIGEWLRFKASTGRKSVPIAEFERSAKEVPCVGGRYVFDGEWWR